MEEVFYKTELPWIQMGYEVVVLDDGRFKFVPFIKYCDEGSPAKGEELEEFKIINQEVGGPDGRGR